MKQENVKWNIINLGDKTSFPEENRRIKFFNRTTNTICDGEYSDGNFFLSDTKTLSDGHAYTVKIVGPIKPVYVDCYAYCDDDVQVYYDSLPEFCKKDKLNIGKYTISFCDDKENWFTYNVYKKYFFGLFYKIMHCSEFQSRAEAFEDSKNYVMSLVDKK